MQILKAEKDDLQKVLELQKKAYLSEAELHNDYNIQPLTQTLEEINEEFTKGTILKAVSDDGKVIGSVRGYNKDNTLYIGKLMVHPDFQNKGIGKMLLKEIETHFPDMRYELFTSTKSDRNIEIYIKSGYSEFKRLSLPNGIELTYMEKIFKK